MGLSVALHLNPAMVVGGFVAPGSAWLGLGSDLLVSVASAVFLVSALCMADGVAWRNVREGDGGVFAACAIIHFYAPKVNEVCLYTWVLSLGLCVLASLVWCLGGG